MERNIGAANRRLPPDVEPKGSTSRDLDRRHEPEEPERVRSESEDEILDHD